MTYQGHRSKAAWNVALWIGNDEGLYRWALELKRKIGAHCAARRMLQDLPAKTPDGYKYTLTSLREAISGLES
jgi:hypothetical protein